MQQLEHARARVHGDADNDALADAGDWVLWEEARAVTCVSSMYAGAWGRQKNVSSCQQANATTP